MGQLLFTISKLGTYNNTDREILVPFTEFEQFCSKVFCNLTCKKINFLILLIKLFDSPDF